MSWFARIEETCAAFIERAFANMFPSDLEPAQIARKLVATMEARTQAEDGGTVAPARYAVYVNAADYERLAPHAAYLEEEWAALLADVAARVGIRFDVQEPRVDLRQSESIVAGAVEIAVFDAKPTGAEYLLRVVRGMPPDGCFRVSGVMRVGRSPDCDLFIVDPSVSRSHALLEAREGGLIVRDNDSTNGTFVNGERVQLRTAQPGDVLAFGKTEMRVEAPR